jgi:hypothetical protein
MEGASIMIVVAHRKHHASVVHHFSQPNESALCSKVEVCIRI